MGSLSPSELAGLGYCGGLHKPYKEGKQPGSGSGGAHL